MAALFLNPEEQGLVVFKIWKSLQYQTRLAISILLILAGFVVQYLLFAIFPGAILILAGNLLLLPKGITNLDNLGIFDPESNWEKVEAQKLDEYLALDRKIRKWDFSSIDVTNALGGLIFFLLLVILIIVTISALFNDNTIMLIVGVDAMILLLPFWLSGFRSIFTVSHLTLKVKLIKRLMEKVAPRLQAHKVDYYFMMRGKEKRIPMDVKFRVNIAGQHKDFLGCYGQITINGPSGGVPYPYFYVVLVAKKRFGLAKVYEAHHKDLLIKKEFKNQEDVEVLVIRQNTDAVSMGYRTTDKQAEAIFVDGLALAEKIAC
ncbi:MAG: hypothetical protein QG657_1128 [Acidobacteriota bacterium]|nr:hypothetical protein [Acidobacteriota bacterium]